MSEQPKEERVYPNVVKNTAKALHYPRGPEEDYHMILMHSKIPRGVEIPIAHIGGIHDFISEYLKHRKDLSDRPLTRRNEVELEVAKEDSSSTARHLLMSFDAVDGWRAKQAVENIANITKEEREREQGKSNLIERFIDKARGR